MSVIIRPARPEDAPELLAIYAPYVTDTTVTFEYDVPSVREFEERIRRVLSRYPYLAAVEDGEIVGYAYAAAFRERVAYIWSCEVSVYVRRDMHRRGVGRALYMELERILRAQNIASMDACISYPNKGSIKFHSDMDFERVARFTRCAFKHGRWVDVVWMQKILTDGPEPPRPFIPYPELAARGEV